MTPAPSLTVTYRVTGTVQGVGFRPFVYRLAHRLGVAGWVRNDAQGVLICAQGTTASLDRFAQALRHEAPLPIRVASLTPLTTEARPPLAGFSILDSATQGPRVAEVTPDLST